MSILITSDTHFSGKHADEFKWDLFPWIKEQISTHNIIALCILGDITQEKDNHHSSLINRIIDNLYTLTGSVEVYLLRGNHDYVVDTNNPFLRFTNKIPRIHFIINPVKVSLDNNVIWLLPNTRNPLEEWQSLDFTDADFIFTHQTYNGAIAETGMQLTGVNPGFFDNVRARVISGDIHKAQTLNEGKITYCGEPYDNRFGNVSHEHRLVLIKNGGVVEYLPYHTVNKHTLYIHDPKDLETIAVNPNDQVKVVLRLNDPLAWVESKQTVIDICKKREIYLRDTKLVKAASPTRAVEESKLRNLSPKQMLEEYIKSSDIHGKYTPYAQTILEELK